MSLKLTFFFPTSAISVGVVGGLTRYLTNITIMNNDHREIKLVTCVACVQRPHKTRSTTSDFPRCRTPCATKKA